MRAAKHATPSRSDAREVFEISIARLADKEVDLPIADHVERGLTSDGSVKSLEDSRLLQFAGERVAEAIARQVIAKAIESGSTLDPPPFAFGAIGADRHRQNLYQMIHVSEGRCRVLIRS